MALVPGDYIKLVVRQSLFNQEVLNVFHYGMGGTASGTAAEIGQAFWDDIKDTIRPCCTPDLQFLEVQVEDNVDPMGDFGTYIIPIGERLGTRTGGTGITVSPFAAASAKFAVGTRVTKPGAMRLAGVDKGDVDDGGILNAGYVGLLTTFGTDLADGFLFAPLSAGNATLVVYGAPHAASTRYPERVDPVYQDVIAVQWSPYLSTQNTRKYNRGA